MLTDISSLVDMRMRRAAQATLLGEIPFVAERATLQAVCTRAAGTRHLPQLDGIRCVAICLVLAHHLFDVGWSWTGVDLFFVLSGFLITQILRKTRHDKNFWGPFYTKRATRILPAFLLCLGLSALVLRGTESYRHWLGYAFFGANVVQALHPFAGGPLNPLWSLAVEEHFYFLWPVAVRYLSRLQLIALVSATLVLEPLLRAFATLHGATWPEIFFLTPFRLDGLAAGALLALLIENESTKRLIAARASALFVLSLAAFGACRLLMHSFRKPADSVSFNAIGYSLVSLICLSIVSYVLLHERSLPARMLSKRPLVFVGVISYGLYLFHILILDAMKMLGIWGRGELWPIASVVLAVFFSWVSFKYFERPIHRWGRDVALGLEGAS